jgi:hypothetical protein
MLDVRHTADSEVGPSLKRDSDEDEWKSTRWHSTCPKDCTNPREGLIVYRVQKSVDGTCEDVEYRCTNCGTFLIVRRDRRVE